MLFNDTENKIYQDARNKGREEENPQKNFVSLWEELGVEYREISMSNLQKSQVEFLMKIRFKCLSLAILYMMRPLEPFMLTMKKFLERITSNSCGGIDPRLWHTPKSRVLVWELS